MSRLFTVAVVLTVVCAIAIFADLFGIAYFVGWIVDPAEDASRKHAGVMYTIYLSIAALYGLVLISGAMCMMRNRWYGWCVTTAVLSLVPILSPCYVLGIPVGIWALVVLQHSEVRRAFADKEK